MKPKTSNKVILFLLGSLCLLALFVGAGQILSAQAGAEFDLQVGLKAPLHVAPDSNLVFNLSYSNIGAAASPDDTRLQVELPDGLSFDSALDQDQNPVTPTLVAGNVLTWTVGVLPAGSCCDHIWIAATVSPSLTEGTLITTTAAISTDTPETNLANNQASVATQICDMAHSTKEANVQQAKPGDVITYTITLRLAQHSGIAAAGQRMVTLTDFLPPAVQARFLGWVGQPAGTYDGNKLQWQGNVGVNAPVRLQYRLGIEGDVPPGESIMNRARVQWSGGEMDLEPVETPIMLSGDDHMFGPGGGQWQHSWGITLTVPVSAVQEMTRFQFRSRSETPPDAPPGWMYAHRNFELTAYQFGEIHQFNQPITITLRYNYSWGESNSLLPNSLRLWYRSGPGEPWAMLGEPLENRDGQISFTTNHFTEFALFGKESYMVMIPLLFR